MGLRMSTEYEYAIEQSGLIFLLSKSGFDTMDEWLAAYPIDPKCERVVKRPIVYWEPV